VHHKCSAECHLRFHPFAVSQENVFNVKIKGFRPSRHSSIASNFFLRGFMKTRPSLRIYKKLKSSRTEVTEVSCGSYHTLTATLRTVSHIDGVHVLSNVSFIKLTLIFLTNEHLTTTPRAGRPSKRGSICSGGENVPHSPQHPQRLRDPPSLLNNRFWNFFLGRKSDRSVKLITQFHLVHRNYTRELTPPSHPPPMSFWRGV
jgi:hypothetical protein